MSAAEVAISVQQQFQDSDIRSSGIGLHDHCGTLPTQEILWLEIILLMLGNMHSAGGQASSWTPLSAPTQSQQLVLLGQGGFAPSLPSPPSQGLSVAF